jgi:3-oxoacyl-[acyl-carrier protein] reductase
MKNRRQGCIINMTSLAAKTGGVASGPAYSASKAGISAYTIGLAKALAQYDIRVNALSPGVIETDMTSTSAHDSIKATIPLGKVGSPTDVANAALFLASDDAAHITGEILDINGGLFMD